MSNVFKALFLSPAKRLHSVPNHGCKILLFLLDLWSHGFYLLMQTRENFLQKVA